MSTWRSHISAHPHNCSLTLSLLELQVVPAEEGGRGRRKRRQVMGLKPLHPCYCCWLTGGGRPDDAVWVMYI